MKKDHQPGMSTISIHTAEGKHPYHSHAAPIYPTSTFSFPDVATGQAIWRGEEPGHIYTRLGNPNLEQLAEKITALEAFDLTRQNPGKKLEEIAAGMVFASGMAAITTALLASLKAGDTVIAQKQLYGATFTFLKNIAPKYGIKVIFVDNPTPVNWQAAFSANPDAKVAYAETPSNPGMALVDLSGVVEAAHARGVRVLVDNTFATPYCQRPLTLGVDVVLHSTTKYLSGHGQVVGGAVVSRHIDFVQNELSEMMITLGTNPSPFDCWMASNGLKTFPLRMERHCSNAMQVARFLEQHPAVSRVNYPGLESHPDHDIARRQMSSYGGMISFELKGGYAAGVKMMDAMKLASLAVSLGTVDTLIQHPASMTHSKVEREDRLSQGITDGLIRLSVGIEEVEDIIVDLDQAMDAG
ncbi:MAG: methionine gamma-lyase [Anaerolinea sp.]|nr:methionine gamma-lyase [Anaerolinea sp.]